jgi:ribosomal protein RSM22 (predicted rRNA methylase)
MKHWSAPQLAALRRLREGFLAGTAGDADYWRSDEELALYDATFGERIGWKWDAVLRELTLRGWRPRSSRVLDWGCGSGIAGRRVLAAWPQIDTLALHDRSPLARHFAAAKARAAVPEVRVETGETITPNTLLLLSHVISELDGAQLARLLDLAAQVREIIWVEAGTHADSRRMCEARDALQSRGFAAIAPCTHAARCGMLAPKNARHWCHHFAAPPVEAFQDARWAEFGRELGIDLRSLPYSFIVLTREAAAQAPGFSRVIGEPREAKGYTRVLSCQEPGVREFILQKRDAPELFRTLRKGRGLPIYRWVIEGERIAAATSVE